MARANDKTVKLNPDIHRTIKALASSRGYAMQQYVEATLYKAMCEEFGEAAVNKLLNAEEDQEQIEF